MLKFLVHLLVLLGTALFLLGAEEATAFPVLVAIFFTLWEIKECLQSE